MLRKLQKLGVWIFATAAVRVMAGCAHAQQDPSKVPPALPKPPDASSIQIRRSEGGLIEFFTARTPYEFWLTVLTAVTAYLIIRLVATHVAKMPGVRPEDVTRPTIVITIVMGSLILIIAGFSNEQIAAAFGLFGTIVGYMLGRMNAHDAASKASPETPTLPTPPLGGAQDPGPAKKGVT